MMNHFEPTFEPTLVKRAWTIMKLWTALNNRETVWRPTIYRSSHYHPPVCLPWVTIIARRGVRLMRMPGLKHDPLRSESLALGPAKTFRRICCIVMPWVRSFSLRPLNGYRPRASSWLQTPAAQTSAFGPLYPSCLITWISGPQLLNEPARSRSSVFVANAQPKSVSFSVLQGDRSKFWSTNQLLMTNQLDNQSGQYLVYWNCLPARWPAEELLLPGKCYIEFCDQWPY